MIRENASEDFCHVCGFSWPYSQPPHWMYEICPCCGVQLGKEDIEYAIKKSKAKGSDLSDHSVFQGYLLEYPSVRRAAWLESGMSWFNRSKKPEIWNGWDQLKNILTDHEVIILQSK